MTDERTATDVPTTRGDTAADKRETARRFGDAASAYFESGVHRDGDDLRTLASWCAAATRALDVATGGGHTAGALAEIGVDRVVAADVAPEMVDTAVREYGVEGVVADAERLPFADDSFDAVSCRIAAHHFPSPEAFVADVARVLEPGGVLAFEDNVAPADPELADWVNGVERLRDPTHVGLRSLSAWRELFADAGLAVESTTVVKPTIDFSAWVERTGVAPPDVSELHRRFREAPDGAHDLFEVTFEGDDDGAAERDATHAAGERRVDSWAMAKALVRVRNEP